MKWLADLKDKVVEMAVKGPVRNLVKEAAVEVLTHTKITVNPRGEVSIEFKQDM